MLKPYLADHDSVIDMSYLKNSPILEEAKVLYNDLKQTSRAIRQDRERLATSKLTANTLPNLEEHLLNVQSRLDRLVSENPNLVAEALAAQAKALRLGINLYRADLLNKKESLTVSNIYKNASLSKRFLTSLEITKVTEAATKRESQASVSKELLSGITSAEILDEVLQTVTTLKLRDAHAELNSGLLLTEQMVTIIDEASPALERGEPMLLIGETGGAKTALGEFLARRLVATKGSGSPEFVSGYGDISSTQVIGAHELRVESGATVSIFVPGPLLRAMSEGTPIILDEINAMPPEFLKRLNRILQLSPGDEYRVQENAGRPITVAPGFAIIATANEQASERYRGIFSLSSELVNRFGANTFRVHYPDANMAFGDDPQENLLLASVALSNERGEFPLNIDQQDIDRVARFAFIAQQIFSGRYGEGFDEFISNDQRMDGRPGLEESVLAPRTLVKLLQNVRDSGGSITIEHALRRFIDGVMNSADRSVLAHIMRSQGFAG